MTTARDPYPYRDSIDHDNKRLNTPPSFRSPAASHFLRNGTSRWDTPLLARSRGENRGMSLCGCVEVFPRFLVGVSPLESICLAVRRAP